MTDGRFLVPINLSRISTTILSFSTAASWLPQGTEDECSASRPINFFLLNAIPQLLHQVI
jgi:hypothetical protein